jgi:2-amino-4-hydroxy-6-hydroxymethyldihydropteridine diphosphokinase
MIGGEGVAVIARSRLYRSPAWPDPSDPEFVNAVARVETNLDPAALLARLHALEASFGRVRREVNAPRTLDLDLIDYDGRISAPGAVPIVPHPRMDKRAFVLLPLADVAPNWRHPASGRAIAELIAALPDPGAATAIAP